jgi:signal transduction histidine kinase
LVFLLLDAEHQIWLENKVKTIAVESHELTKMFYDVGSAVVLYGVTRNKSFLGRYEDGMKAIPDQVTSIKKSVHELNPTDHTFDQVETDAFNGLESLRQMRAKAELGDTRALFSREARGVLQEYVNGMDHFVEQQKEIQNQAPEKAAKSRRAVIYWLGFGVVFNVALGFGLALYFNRGTTRRLSVLMENTLKLAKHQDLNPPIGGADEIGHLDQVFHEMADALEEAAMRKQELVSMVSHDLRTPLMSMQVSLELLSAGAMGELPDQARKELSVAEYSATRLIHLINDLLDIDKMEAGRFEIISRHTEICTIFERCIRSVRALADRHQVSIAMPDDDDTKVFADPDRLAQVITNLLSNAIKFSPPGSQVTMDYEDLPDATIIKIIDQGRGIPKGFEQKIFERFQQVSAKDATEKKGSGLGLAICKAIVDAHNGTIGVQSAEGQGSTFWFRVPKEGVRIEDRAKQSQTASHS